MCSKSPIYLESLFQHKSPTHLAHCLSVRDNTFLLSLCGSCENDTPYVMLLLAVSLANSLKISHSCASVHTLSLSLWFDWAAWIGRISFLMSLSWCCIVAELVSPPVSSGNNHDSFKQHTFFNLTSKPSCFKSLFSSVGDWNQKEN